MAPAAVAVAAAVPAAAALGPVAAANGQARHSEEEVRAHRKKRPWYRDVRHSNEYDDESEELEDHEVESLRSRARSSRSSRRGPSRTAPISIVTLDPSPESEDGYEAEPEEKTSKVLVEL